MKLGKISKSVLFPGLLLCVGGLTAGGLASCSSNKSDPSPAETVATETGASDTSVAETTAAADSSAAAPVTTESLVQSQNILDPKPGQCPNADGSSPKKQKFDGEQPRCIDLTKKYKVTMETTKGTMVFELDPTIAPRTVNNFVTLAGFHYFDGIKFHRVVRDFVIQGGDPEGTGGGGPGYAFADELPQAGQYKVGSLAMANAGANTNGSQFFIITGAQGAALPPNYSLFGQILSGQDVMSTINQLGPVEANGAAKDGPPSEEVSMTKVTAAAEQ